jgi:hypothetical protein
LPVAEVYSGDVHADERPRRQFDRDSVRAEHGRTHPLDHRGLDAVVEESSSSGSANSNGRNSTPSRLERARRDRVVQCPGL